MPALLADYRVRNTASYKQEAEATQRGHMTMHRKEEGAKVRNKIQQALLTSSSSSHSLVTVGKPTT